VQGTLIIFTALHEMQTWSSDENSVLSAPMIIAGKDGDKATQKVFEWCCGWCNWSVPAAVQVHNTVFHVF